MNATRLRLLLSLVALSAVCLVWGPACGGKKIPGQISRVILARQRNFGFVFELKSPGGSLDQGALRQFADTLKGQIKNLYHPNRLEEFQVKPRGGSLRVVDVVFKAAQADYDDTFLLGGEVTQEGFTGRIRVINTAGAGVVADEKLEIQRDQVQTPGAQGGELRTAPTIGEAAAHVIEEALVAKYHNPNEYEPLGIRPGEAMAGIESLADTLVKRAGCAGVTCLQELPRSKMDEAYVLLNYARQLLARVREAYVKNKISVKTVDDTQRIQRLSEKIGRLTEVTGYYEEEVAINAADFKVEFDFQNVNETFQGYFRQALVKSGLETAIRLYTVKPAQIAVVYDVTSDAGTIFLKLRYSNRRYLAWLKKKRRVIGNTRILPFSYFNKLMAGFYKYRIALLKSGTTFDHKTLAKFGLMVELQRKLYGSAQMRVSVFEGKLQPISSLRIQLCDYPSTDVPTAKPNFTSKTKLYALGTPQNVAGQRLPYASVYEFFSLDALYGVEYPRACQVGSSTDIYVDTGSKGARQKVTIP